MKKIIISIIITMALGFALAGCASARKTRSELRGLMLLDNIQLGRNKAYYSKHNIKTKKIAYRKYRKNSRYL